MTIFLDTHVWLWFLVGSDELDSKIVKKIKNIDNQVLISCISFWEGAMLAEKKRLSCSQGQFIEIARKSLQDFREAHLTAEICLLSRELDFKHEDPADRFIASTSYAYDATLFTRDRRLLDLKWLKTQEA